MIHLLASTTPGVPTIHATEVCLAQHLTLATTPTPTTFYTSTGSVSTPQEFFPSPSACTVKVLLLRLGEVGPIAGMAIYYPTFSTWRCAAGIHLEDLVVKDEFRGRGYGEMLIKALAGIVRDLDGGDGKGRLEWVCERGNVKAMRLYDKVRAEKMDGWVGLRLEGSGLEALVEGRKEA